LSKSLARLRARLAVIAVCAALAATLAVTGMPASGLSLISAGHQVPAPRFHAAGIVPIHVPGSARPTAAAKAAMRSGASSIAGSNPACSGCTPPLLYNGGPVMAGDTPTPGTATVTPVLWAPPGYGFASSYTQLLERYLSDVAAASGTAGVSGNSQTGNVFSVLDEYWQNLGGGNQYLSYSVTAASAITDTDAYPAQSLISGCVASSGYSACVDDSAIQTELSHLTASRGLQTDQSHLYLVLFPSGVDTCMSAGTSSAGDQCSDNVYCGYHDAFGNNSGSYILYADLPYPVSGCGSPRATEYPNGNPAADTEISVLSHETLESITDWAGNAWYDSGGSEIGDECAYVYGNLLGQTNGSGTGYNQVINGHYYYTQDEFSNGAYAAGQGDLTSAGGSVVIGCEQRDTAPSFSGGTPPTGTTGAPYSFDVGAQGLPTPTVSLASGSLPPGLALSGSGSVSGTPSQSGTWSATLSASNHVGSAATEALSITIDPGSSPSTVATTTTSTSTTTTTTTTLAPTTTTTTAPAVPPSSSTTTTLPASSATTVAPPTSSTTLPPPPAPVVSCPTGHSGETPSSATVSVASTDVNGCQGYWVADSTGRVEAFGAATFYGGLAGVHLEAPVISMTATADGRGYWLLAADGGVFTFGDARFEGSTGGIHLAAPIVSMAVDPATGGYWLVAQDGGIFSFNAPFYGSTGNLHLHKPVDGMAVAPGGNGYWLVASDGGVFTFTHDGFYGSLGTVQLSEPVVGMSSTSDGGGYTLVAADGGVFNFGDSPFYGSLGGHPPATPVVDLSATPGNLGYLLVDSSGQVFSFGNAQYFGSA
jgi:hypothetical protein